MRRSFISLAFAASLASGCLGAVSTPPPGGGPDPGTPGTTDPNSGGPDPSPSPSPSGGHDAGTPAPAWDLAGPPSPMGTISVSLASSSESLKLNDSKTVTVNLMPGNGFNGMTMFSVEGLPQGVTAAFTPPGAMMSGPMSATLTITTASSTVPAAGMPITVKASSGAIVGQAALTIDVTAELLVKIPKGVNIGSNATPNTSAFGAASIPVLYVSPGTKVTFINEDSINHEIHSDGTLGIAHEGGPLQAGGANSYTQTFNGKGTFDFRCHIHPNMKGQIVVQ
ncbi:MAG TPA: plastocyanin/azurin family copper-binding protein [Polyangia bacterium]|nr:plastocyanin/azurin family copper-binding protein [Polyangia bacterium]